MSNDDMSGDPSDKHTGSAEGAAVQASGPALAVGARVECEVTRIENEGAYVQVRGTSGRDGRGLLPNIETGLPRGSDPRKHFTVGQVLETKIVAVDEGGRLRVSIRALVADDEKALFAQFADQERAKADKPAGFGTLGDLLSRSQRGKPKRK